MGLIEFKRQSYQIESDHQFAEIDLIRTRGCAFGSVVQWKAFAENPLFENFFRRAFDQKNWIEKNWNIIMDSENWIITFLLILNSHTPVGQKVADEVVVRHFQGEWLEFFKIGPQWPPPQIFVAHLLENINLSPSSFHFSMGFISRSCFESNCFTAYPNEWNWREKKKRFLFSLTNL